MPKEQISRMELAIEMISWLKVDVDTCNCKIFYQISNKMQFNIQII